MPADFLMQQMAWREALDEAATRRGAGGDRCRRAGCAPARRLRRLAARSTIGGDSAAAARQVRALMFVERFAADVDDRLGALEA